MVPAVSRLRSRAPMAAAERNGAGRVIFRLDIYL